MLSQLTKHFVIASKRMCKDATPSCKTQARDWAQVLIILQSSPEICNKDWRKMNPTIMKRYMGEFKTFNTSDLWEEMLIKGKPTCKCVNNIILRSNDGITAENEDEQCDV